LAVAEGLNSVSLPATMLPLYPVGAGAHTRVLLSGPEGTDSELYGPSHKPLRILSGVVEVEIASSVTRGWTNQDSCGPQKTHWDVTASIRS
jgi:hypothetical protein